METGSVAAEDGGFRAEVEVPDPPDCPVATATAEAETTAGSVTWTGAGGDTVTEQFVMEDGDGAGTPDGVERVFDYGEEAVYRFERRRDRATGGDGEAGSDDGEAAPGDGDADDADRSGAGAPGTDGAPATAGGACACERVEALSCPVADVRAEEGSLFLTLYLTDLADLRAAVSELRSAYDGVTVRSIAYAGEDRDLEDVVPVDRARLTDRQREALTTAHEMGYFEYPRRANASEVAEALGIGPSTLIEHLTAAQSKLLEDLLGTE